MVVVVGVVVLVLVEVGGPQLALPLRPDDGAAVATQMLAPQIAAPSCCPQIAAPNRCPKLLPQIAAPNAPPNAPPNVPPIFLSNRFLLEYKRSFLTFSKEDRN